MQAQVHREEAEVNVPVHTDTLIRSERRGGSASALNLFSLHTHAHTHTADLIAFFIFALPLALCAVTRVCPPSRVGGGEVFSDRKIDNGADLVSNKGAQTQRNSHAWTPSRPTASLWDHGLGSQRLLSPLHKSLEAEPKGHEEV